MVVVWGGGHNENVSTFKRGGAPGTSPNNTTNVLKALWSGPPKWLGGVCNAFHAH